MKHQELIYQLKYKWLFKNWLLLALHPSQFMWWFIRKFKGTLIVVFWEVVSMSFDALSQLVMSQHDCYISLLNSVWNPLIGCERLAGLSVWDVCLYRSRCTRDVCVVLMQSDISLSLNAYLCLCTYWCLLRQASLLLLLIHELMIETSAAWLVIVN